MRLPAINYLRPENLDHALQLLGQYGEEAVILAGGSDLMVQLKNRNTTVGNLVDLGELKDLNYMEFDAQSGLKIGATTTLLEIIRNSTIQDNYPALIQAADAVGAFPHQAMGTIGGNICLNTRCWYYNQSSSWRKAREVCRKMGGEKCHVMLKSADCHASYCGDTAGILIAYGATVTLRKQDGSRTIPLEQLFSGDGKCPHALESGEILTEVQVPAPQKGQRSVYLKLRQRSSIDFPQAGVALNTVWEGNTCTHARLVLTAVAPRPVVVSEAGSILVGNNWDAALLADMAEAARQAGNPVANMTGSVSYRKKMLTTMTLQALDAVSQANNQ